MIHKPSAYLHFFFFFLNTEDSGLPWWSSGYESASDSGTQVRQEYSFDLWSRRIPHAAEQLSPVPRHRSSRLKPKSCNYRSLSSARACTQRPHKPPAGKSACHNREQPRSAQLDSPHAALKTQRDKK